MMLPSWFAAGVGAWLFASVFIWDHLPAARANTMIVGALIAAVAVAAMWRPRLRYANTSLIVLGASLSPAAAAPARGARLQR